MLPLKNWLLTNRLGIGVLHARALLERLRFAVADVSHLGFMANDHLATYLLVRLPRPNTTFIDVGAHLGSVTAQVLRRERSIKVHAIEAVGEKAARLRCAFPGITVHACALGEHAGEVSFFVNMLEPGFSSLTPDQPVADRSGLQERRVTMKTLDELVAARDVDTIKIDVEGAELGVIRGARRVLRECRPTIMFESGPPEVLGFTKRAMFDELTRQDYVLLLPDRMAHTAPEMTESIFLDSHHHPPRSMNYFAVARERRDELRQRARQALGIGGSAA
jgi:FkbM family methyltransferase